jgi:Concanavalin A-like lectin/glucanases superfamily
MKRFVVFLFACFFVAAPTLRAQTIAGGALSFDGIDDAAEIAVSPSLALSGVTFEAWVYTTEARCNTILSRGDNGEDYIFQVGYDGAGDCGARRVSFYTGIEGWSTSSDTVPLNTWTHVAMTYSGTTVTFYINGTQSGSAVRSFPLSQNGNVISIGRQGTPFGCNCNFFTGQMDELRIWNTVRTEAEISQNMSHSLTGTDPGLVAYYRFDEEDGVTTADSTANGNTGILLNGIQRVPSTVPLVGLRAFTGGVTGITPGLAVLYGTVNPNNEPTRAWFEFGPTTDYGNSTPPIFLSASSSDIPITNTISGLLPGTQYHFQLVATNSSGIARGADLTFTTPSLTIQPLGRRANGAFQARFEVQGGIDYTIQGSVDLQHWSDLLTLKFPKTGPVVFIDTAATNYPARFYRFTRP